MLGLCCQLIDQNDNNLLFEKKLLLNQFEKGRYSDQKIIETWLNNLYMIHKTLPTIYESGIKVFRLSSNTLPLFDKNKHLHDDPRLLKLLTNIGNFVKSKNIRITTHPDQFVVLSSGKCDVVKKSIDILEEHAWIFDKMGLDSSPFYSINIHGGTKGNSSILINSILSLPGNIKNRLTLENDESSYSVPELFKVSQLTSVPICMDTHHFKFNPDGLKLEESMDLAIKTWGTIKPLTHLSNTTPGLESGSFQEKRKHSDYVHYFPEYQLELNNKNLIDVDMEFKKKNLAIFKCIKDFNVSL